MDVWLLGKLEPVLAKGAQRRNAVIIGKHGLKIAKGDHHGLLLPGVAVEHHLDAEGFLEQVCRKAGLPADAWQDDDAVLMTFQGHAIEGELKTFLPTEAGDRFSPAVGSTADRIAVANVPQPRAARISACRRRPARFIPAMRKRSTARLTSGSRTGRSPNRGRRSWFPMPAGSIRAGWPPMSSAA